MLTHTARVALSLIAVFLLLDITKVGGSVIGETRRDEEERNNDTATAPLQVMVIPSHVQIHVGQRKRVLCRATGKSESVVWIGPDGGSISENDKNIKAHRHDEWTSSLVIVSAQVEDAGVYTCVAENTHTSAQAELNLEVVLKRARRKAKKEERGKRQKEPKPTKKPKGAKTTKKPKTDKKDKKKKGKKDKEVTTTTLPPTTTTTTTTEPPTTEPPTTEPPTTTFPPIDYDDEFVDPFPDDYWDEEETKTTTVPPDTPTQKPTDDRDLFPTDEYSQPFDSDDDYWKVDEPEPTVPVISGKGKEEDDYWDPTFEVPESIPFPDGKEISPTDPDWSYTITEEPTVPTYENKWYEEYDYTVHEKKKDDEQERLERERERDWKEKEEREREERWREEEEEEEERERRIKKPPRIYREPKICPPLGLESHRIDTDQLQASSMYHHRYGSHRARLNIQASGDEYDMNGGAWCANPDEKVHWIELDTRTLTEFTGVITQGRDDPIENDYVTSYYVAFSNDSREWTLLHDGYSEWLFFGNSDKHTPVMSQFMEPVVARYIRILPQSWNGTACMRLEILGCPVPDPLSENQRQNEVTPRDDLDYTYHNYLDMEKLMKSITDECPNITRMYSLGKSSKGLDIYAMEITDNPGIHETSEPEFRYTAGYHGNEALGRELLMMLMQYLCKEYNDGNPRVRTLVDGIRIHLVPSVNPDGHETAFEKGSELGSWTLGHWTEDGHDIFQNFPDLNTVYWNAEDKGMVPKLTPNHHVPIPDGYLAENGPLAVETRALISWMESHPFVLGANLQGGERMVTYPFDMRRLTKESEELEKKLNPRAYRRKRQYEEEEAPESNPYLHIGYHQESYGDHQEHHGYHQESYGDHQERHGYHQESYGDHQERHGYHQETYGYHQESYGYHQENQEYHHQENQGYHHEGHSEGYQEGYHEGYQEGYHGGYQEGHQEEGYEQGYGQAEPEEIRVVEDQSLFRWLAISYASTHRTMTHTFRSGCHTEDPTGGIGIVNRAKWKPIPGSMNDFSYLHTNCFELSIFLGCDKYPHQSELLKEWEYNREALLTLMDQVHRGIKGVVRDKEGNPIVNASISVEGVSHDVTTGEAGDYWRMLNPGEYQVTARANGYSSMSRKCVVGFEPGATLCNFELNKSNWDRIKEIMALHGNKPIRLLSPGRGSQYTFRGDRKLSNQIPNGNGGYTERGRLRRLRLIRLRELRKKRLTTTLPPTTTEPTTPTTTTPTPTTTNTVPLTTEDSTLWYDSWLPEEENSTQPELEITDSLDYDYGFNTVDY
ncbi:inactive carboxypeptidase-like protein X2 isoform X1 [Pangasianodon hypophthalmus]|uniref:inactive carboxypeptidase-like protein X2 isoform X1 n=1 Tax=Pangasianodon hypophthalmus TaxID=310915 RepID=UPI002307DF1C|nr:inactive carboxypeptidase-like protein X2 isoform X1 [Pangasianodon hypophthalmus]